jgi:hypothetical protein
MVIAPGYEAELIEDVAPENLKVFLRVTRKLLSNLDRVPSALG